ncbi:palmitoyl-(protein) hydrolase [Aureococcus anophagefferens]|uniref:Palmitoyl-(Protein) hydrolase n=1 Tax=Aureococcus anophagefferens TaxID=44056 RepID=A0ABR1FNV9_AURAN
MVAQDRFGQSQLRSFAERIAEIVAPVVDECAASAAHANAALAILAREPRSLERELRHGANVLRLDVTELERRFRSAPQAALDFEARGTASSRAAGPRGPSALAGPPPDDDEETKDEETKEERVVEDPAARAAAWKPDKKPALRHASRTGWGSLVSRDGLVKKRVWLELRDAPPRTLRYAPDTASPRRLSVSEPRARVIRCDAPCTLQLRLNLPNDDLVVGFERVAPEAKTESRGALAKLSELSTLKTDDAMSYIVGGAWYNKMANFLVCAVDCTGGQPFEGPERPFMQLNRPPGPAPARVPGKPLGGAGNARKSSIIRARDLGDSLRARAFSVAGPEVKAAYQSLLKVIIRPPRATYDERRLGVADFAIKTEATTHRTFER